MTIDELIKQEFCIADKNQKIVDTHMILDDCSLEEMYADDTEIIEEQLSGYQFVANYHRQIADMLCELKAYREGTL